MPGGLCQCYGLNSVFTHTASSLPHWITAPALWYLFLSMSAQSSKSKGQQHAVPSAGEVEDTLRDHKAHSEKQVACRKKGDHKKSQTQGKDSGRWKVFTKLAIFRFFQEKYLTRHNNKDCPLFLAINLEKIFSKDKIISRGELAGSTDQST